MPHADWLAALSATPDDKALRLVYADWLEECGQPGAAYLRAEVALSRAPAEEAPPLRHALLKLIPSLPTRWRDRLEQPDMLLAPPVPFKLGWYAANAAVPLAYRTLAHLNPDSLAPDLPWRPQADAPPRVDQAEHEREEHAALAELRQRAAPVTAWVRGVCSRLCGRVSHLCLEANLIDIETDNGIMHFYRFRETNSTPC